MPKVEVGQKVPNFKLPASNGEQFSLNDRKGKKVVLFFYPKDMTAGCTKESCQFRDFNDQFKALNTEVIGISPDDLKSHERFISGHNLPFLLLSDEDRKVCELFDVWQMKKLYGREYMGVVRSTFLIDEKGKLVEEWRNVKIKDHVQKVLEAVKSL